MIILDIGGGTCDISALQVTSDDGELSEMHHGDGILQGGLNVADKFFETLRLPTIFGKAVDKFEKNSPEAFGSQRAEFMSKQILVKSENIEYNVPLQSAFTKFIFKSRRKGNRRVQPQVVRKKLKAKLKKLSKAKKLIPDFKEMPFKAEAPE